MKQLFISAVLLWAANVTAAATPPSSNGDAVQTSALTTVRSAANGAPLGTQVAGAQGRVIGGPVAAGGSTWWNIDFLLSPDGWCDQATLQKEPYSVTITSDIQYGTGLTQTGNIPLLLDVYEPVNAPGNRKALVNIHGGGFKSGDKTNNEAATLCNALAANGYVCVSINYRLEGDDPLTQGPDLHSRAQLAAFQDASVASFWLVNHASQYQLDTNRIGIGGSSAGAGTALFVGYGGLFKAPRMAAVVDFSGAMNGNEVLVQPGEPPLFIIHGTLDTTVPYVLAQALDAQAQSVGIFDQFVTVPGAGHVQSVLQTLGQDVVNDMIRQFLDTHLTGILSPLTPPSAPTISLSGGPFPNPVTVTLASLTVGSTIHYTTDGSVPTADSPLYWAPFTLTSPTQVRAIAANSGSNVSSESRLSVGALSSSVTSSVRVWPNPFRSDYGHTSVTFDQMGSNSVVKIFTVSGHFVKTLRAPGGVVNWDLTNSSGDRVASGIYLYVITDDQGGKLTDKLVVIR